MANGALVVAAALVGVLAASAAQMPTGKVHTTSQGLRFVRIEPGTFHMGFGTTPLPASVAGQRWRRLGDPDEHPAHRVALTRPFYLAATEVTNAQFERFEPAHRALRGKLGFSKADDEAVVFVSWHEAVAFCRWLSKAEGLPCRLPTEAEWEYACRAGTTTAYHTGDTLPRAFHKNVRMSWFPDPGRSRGSEVVPLTVGKTPPNPWGLFDVHGNVEEWCLDWYGPYEKGPQTDPVGRADGDWRVTRGGSHSTELFYLRSANRAGALPEDRTWLIGFRVAIAPLPDTKPLPPPPPPRHQRNVRQQALPDLARGPDPTKPHFRGPRVYIRIPPGSNGPLYSHHNHCPAIVDCPNGDLLAIWYTCVQEPGRELGILGARLRHGADAWEPADVFWDGPDRNDHASALWRDEKGILYHFNGLSVAATWGSLATILRTSTDSGATWTKARLIIPEHGTRHMPIESVQRLRQGHILLPCDAVTGGRGGTAIWLSKDGETWADPGGKAAGIHAGIVQLKDGRLLALGRGDNVDGKMPKSISTDLGKTWTYSASPFPPIGGGQRLVLLRLAEGPLLFCSYARRIDVTDAAGNTRPVSGLFAALSHDEGETWDVRRVLSDDGPGRKVESFDGRPITLSSSASEPRGYLSVCQAPNGVIHLISSRLHYEFNYAWLKAAPPAAPPPPPPPEAEKLPVKASLAMVYEPTTLPTKARPAWRYNGTNVSEADGTSFPAGGVMKLNTGGGQRCRWVLDRRNGFRPDPTRGMTVELRLQVLKSTSGERGIDLEAVVGGRRSFITITRNSVWWYGEQRMCLAARLDNHSAMHTFRIAVRPDGIAQVYRDADLLGVRAAPVGADGLAHAAGDYIQWGEGAGASEADALIAHVAYDLAGPSQPAR